MQGKIKNIPVEEQGFKLTIERLHRERQDDTREV
jgi:hypothetical protein